MAKPCSACGVITSESGFYAKANKCKECTKAAVRARRVENIESVREYDRRRSKLPHRIANATRCTHVWRQQHRDRMKAHNAAARGDIEKPDRCEGCGREVRIEKHHPDYSRPLLVVWLCKPCHAIADKIRRRLEAS